MNKVVQLFPDNKITKQERYDLALAAAELGWRVAFECNDSGHEYALIFVRSAGIAAYGIKKKGQKWIVWDAADGEKLGKADSPEKIIRTVSLTTA